MCGRFVGRSTIIRASSSSTSPPKQHCSRRSNPITLPVFRLGWSIHASSPPGQRTAEQARTACAIKLTCNCVTAPYLAICGEVTEKPGGGVRLFARGLLPCAGPGNHRAAGTTGGLLPLPIQKGAAFRVRSVCTGLPQVVCASRFCAV